MRLYIKWIKLSALTFFWVCFVLFSSFFISTSSYAGRVLNDHLSAGTGALTRFSHHVWQEVLSESVNEQGLVDFNAIRSKPRRLNQYMAQLASTSPDSHPELFKGNNARLAYWINAYNALSLRTILDYYPIASLEMIPGGLKGFRGKSRYALGGSLISIEDLEQKIVAEFHWKAPAFFALTDLGYTSPPLWNQAYLADGLDKQLEERLKSFIDNSQNVTVQSYCTPVMLSPVFWQFERPLLRYTREERQIEGGTILDFILPYVAPEIRGYLSRSCDRELIYKGFDSRLQDLL